MSKIERSAKDKAFDKERAKYRASIRELENEVKSKNIEIYNLKETISDLESKITEREDWIVRLLEYTELSEEDMKKIVEREKKNNKIASEFSKTIGAFTPYLDILLTGRFS